MVDVPGFVECMEHITRDDAVTCEADVAEQLMVVYLTVCQSFLLVVPGSKKWLLTFGTHKVLHVPGLAQGVHHTLLYGASAGATNRYAHLVMTTEAVELSIHLPGIGIQLNTA